MLYELHFYNKPLSLWYFMFNVFLVTFPLAWWSHLQFYPIVSLQQESNHFILPEAKFIAGPDLEIKPHTQRNNFPFSPGPRLITPLLRPRPWPEWSARWLAAQRAGALSLVEKREGGAGATELRSAHPGRPHQSGSGWHRAGIGPAYRRWGELW